MNRIPKAAAAVLGVALLASACSSNGTAEQADTGTPQAASGSTTTLSPTASVAPTTTVAEARPEALPVNPDLGIEVMSVLSAGSGDGTRPLLEWESVQGAFMYSLAVLTPGEEPYWAWEGTATAVHIGGEPQLEEFAAGPSVVPGMTWSVAAYNDEFHVIAVSPRAPISP